MSKYILLFTLICLISINASAQNYNLKKTVTADEVKFLKQTIRQIAKTDQQYRRYLSLRTLDKKVIDKLDSVEKHQGAEAAIRYRFSLKTRLSKATKDSLWRLQHATDFHNHQTMKGIFITYGYLPKALLGKDEFVQLLLLVHPPKDWNIRQYLTEYSQMLLKEVKSGRMPAKTYATFYDNIKGKILRECQLYGTNQQYDPKTKKILPPQIENLAKSNAARKAIGLPTLKKGEYRLVGGK